MGQIGVKNILAAANLSGGQTKHWRWNNAANATVYDFSLVVHAFSGTPSDPSVELSPLRYGRKVSNNSRFVDFSVTNLSPHSVTYQVYMSWAKA